MEKESMDLEVQYANFLQRMGLVEATMSPIQRTQIKQVFYAAIGVAIVLFLDIGDHEGEAGEQEAIAKMDSLNQQVTQFFIKETNQQN